MLKKILSITITTIMILTMSTVAFAEEYISNIPEVSIEDINSMLREANTPETEIQSMDNELKRHIYDNSLLKEEVEYIEVTQEKSAANLARSGYTIPTNELKLSVVAFKVSGKDQVDIYPSYEFLVPVKPKGKDYFAYSTHDSFSAVSGERSNLLWYKLNKSDSWTRGDEITYTGTSTTGYQHYGSSMGTPDSDIYLKGNFYYKVDIDSSSPVKKIVLAYVHDTSWGGSASYGIGYGPFSISITPQSSSVGYQNNIYNLNY